MVELVVLPPNAAWFKYKMYIVELVKVELVVLPPTVYLREDFSETVPRIQTFRAQARIVYFMM